MKRFYVSETGAYIKKRGNNLLVCKDGKKMQEIPLEQVRQITLMGRISFSSAVLDELIRRRIETILLSPYGYFKARLVLNEHAHVERRRRQYALLSDPESTLKIAAEIVHGKLRSMSRFISKESHKSKDNILKKASIQLRALAEIARKAENLNVLRGIEGKGSAVYFSVFEKFIKNKNFFFKGRNKRPPLDPVNAMLSFVYTLLTAEVLTAIQLVGLDPYLGSLHEVEYGRPSLACDLVEEWRVFLADRFVLKLINLKAIKPDDFVFRPTVSGDGIDEEDLKKNRPVEMKPASMRTLIASYETWMERQVKCLLSDQIVTHRGLIRNQARRFLAVIMGEKENYEAYPWWKL